MKPLLSLPSKAMPLVAMQSLDNAQDVTVCRNCLGFAGDVISQLDNLTGLNRPECLARHKARQRCSKSNGYDDQTAPAHELSGLYECLGGCGEVYCSPRCRSEHWERCHRLLCVGPVPDEEAQSHPLVEFRIHAMQTNEIFLLVGEVMAQIATAFTEKVREKPGADGSGGDLDVDDEISAARAPFADFVQEPWWDVAVARDGRDKTDGSSPPPCTPDDGCNGDENVCAAAAALPGTLRALCGESSALLRRAFARSVGPLPAPLEQALTAEMFGRVVGMFEQNNVGIRAPSPIPEVLRELLSASSEGDSDDATRGISREVLGEVAQLVGEVMDDEYEEEEGEDEDEGDLPMICRVSPRTFVAGDDALEGSGMGPGEAETILKVAMDGGGEEGEEVVSLFPPLDGTALYPLICCMNHSCRPNCLVRYPGRRREKKATADPEKAAGAGAGSADPLVAQLVLLEDVPAGEELTQSYVTREMGLVERREALEDYGFFCTCPRCLEEEAMASS
ncbi:conserved unknown protein [Ectocarpus siliculosus]|uniref:SET domain-containing protein n=1 Tax=Ectocarpus siliculosus TaxID=2880 RepID=D8LEQ6_ECTSI|nr:conserved unknown protein [Ectocarpus siliculosus]|eukprot:CBN78619.1 conserved unknown protein [Ectocarpus siliculosus]